MKTTIIIPTYNERENIETIILKIKMILPEVDILVVDDNSPDLTHQVVVGLQTRVSGLSLLLREKKAGLGQAYLAGFKKVLADGQSEAVIMMDADLSHDPSYLPQFFAAVQDHDVVVGSRYIAGGGTTGWELWRRLLSKYGNYYARFIIGMPVHDCTGGFNLIKTDLLRRLDLAAFDSAGYAFQIELKYLLKKAGGSFQEVPIIFRNRVNGQSKISHRIIQEGIVAPWRIRRK